MNRTITVTLATVATLATIAGSSSAVPQLDDDGPATTITVESATPPTTTQALIPLTSASTVDSQRFVAVATADGLPSDQVGQLLSSGAWVGYTTKVVLAAAHPPPGQPWPPYSMCWDASFNRAWVHGENSAGKETWRFTLGEGYCFRHRRGDNNDTVYSFDRIPTVIHSSPLWAQALGWSWDGMDDSGAFGPSTYQYLSNGPASALKTWRVGHFKYCPIHLPFCYSDFPWIHMYNHADGTDHISGGKG